MNFGPEPISTRGFFLDDEEKKIMFEVISLLKMKGLSVHGAEKIIKAVSSEIQSAAAQEKL